MLETYIIKAELPLNQQLFDFLTEFVSPQRRSALMCRKNRHSAETSLLGELLAKYAIKKHFGIPVSKQHFLKAGHGKPYLKGYSGIHFNISHSGEYVVCAVSDAPVGIDIQIIGEYKDRVAKRICTADELLQLENNGEYFTRLWTQKEAVLKLYGTGFADSNIKECLKNSNIETFKYDNCFITVAKSECKKS